LKEPGPNGTSAGFQTDENRYYTLILAEKAEKRYRWFRPKTSNRIYVLTYSSLDRTNKNGMCKDKTDVVRYFLSRKVAYYNLPRGNDLPRSKHVAMTKLCGPVATLVCQSNTFYQKPKKIISGMMCHVLRLVETMK
jgi:hypothetical protein